MSKKLKVQVKINTKKLETFQDTLEALISGGVKDIFLTENQTVIYVYLQDENYRGLKLNINGTWELE